MQILTNVLKTQQVATRDVWTLLATTHVPVTAGTLSALIIITSVLVSTWCVFNIRPSLHGAVLKGFAHSVQILTSALWLMVAVVTTVTILMAPTTATVVLGTHWTVTHVTAMVRFVVWANCMVCCVVHALQDCSYREPSLSVSQSLWRIQCILS